MLCTQSVGSAGTSKASYRQTLLNSQISKGPTCQAEEVGNVDHIFQHAIPKGNMASPELSAITPVSNGMLLRSSLTHFPNFVNGQTYKWLLSNCEAQPVLSKASYLNLQFTSNSFLMIILLNNKLEHDSHCKKG